MVSPHEPLGKGGLDLAYFLLGDDAFAPNPSDDLAVIAKRQQYMNLIKTTGTF